jgi:GTP-binding protein LepA
MDKIRNFVIIAHIDAGKSTLADRMLEVTKTVEKRKMKEQYLDVHPLERERGITIKLQPVRMKYKEYIFNLIDTPGHVDFSYEVSRSLAAVEGAILLVDATKGVQAQTLSNLHAAVEQKLDIIPVINKIDLPNARIEEVENQIVDLIGADKSEILKISAKNGENVEQVLDTVIEKISPPKKGSGRFKALIFDSMYDVYKGVVVFVRVFDGFVEPSDRLTFMASKAKTEAKEVGHFKPELMKTSKLSDGEIGFIATGLKEVAMARVGDTIAHIDSSIRPLPGYNEPKPVVFASFFPRDADDYVLLKDALDKMKLSDGALTFEPQSTEGLGRGFRCGFLGMLHVEIVSEKLKRDFNLDLIISTPSVEYKINMKDGETIYIRSAGSLPDPNLFESIEEPVVATEVIAPNEYLGALMNLMAETRSIYQSTEYVGKETILLKYIMPLAEMVEDFYDRLKSVSSGYASFNYEPYGYNKDDLVKLDILIAGDLVEPFSKIVHRTLAYKEGKRMVDKLKEVTPAQQFAVAIQAAVGGKIIARQDMKARRKDVTGYLYGGDVTRKKKLLEKQKKGKAKLKERGRVNLPQKVFLEMLRR